MTGPQWYVVNTHPRSEGRAEINLRRQGFVTYLPRYMRERRHGRRVDSVPRPLFPRYLFVALDLAKDRWRAIQSTFGVAHLVSAGDAPLSISTSIVDEIRARESGDGFIKLGLPPGVRSGTPVRLTDGIFAEYVGVIDRIADSRRGAVLLQLLGREVRVLVPAANIGTV